jgi:predicted O-methyltransferase YrrM
LEAAPTPKISLLCNQAYTMEMSSSPNTLLHRLLIGSETLGYIIFQGQIQVMLSKVALAAEVLQREGPVPLVKKTSLFLARRTNVGRRFLCHQCLKQVRERMKEEEGLDDILDTVLDIKPGIFPYKIEAMQLRDEIESFMTFVEKEQPESVLEIGTARGGTFYIWSRYLDSVDKIISLDLPESRFGKKYDGQMTDVFREFSTSKEMHFIRHNSHQESTYGEVSEIVDDGIDLLFIDGDHTYEGVKRDFEMYSKLVSEGGFIAFHDIVPHADSKKQARKMIRRDGIEERYVTAGDSSWNVAQFWDEISSNYESNEFRSHPKQMGKGIGVIQL